MEDTIQTMPNNEYQLKAEITIKEFLNFYRNTWTRYLTSRLIDVEADRQLAAINPEELVSHGDKDQYGRYFEEVMPVRFRLEKRKLLVENAMGILKAVNALLETPSDQFAATHMSEEALSVSESVVKEMNGEAPTIAEGEPVFATASVEDSTQEEGEKITEAEVVTPAAESTNEAAA